MELREILNSVFDSDSWCEIAKLENLIPQQELYNNNNNAYSSAAKQHSHWARCAIRELIAALKCPKGYSVQKSRKECAIAISELCLVHEKYMALEE